jgi:outer membrane protein TolC
MKPRLARFRSTEIFPALFGLGLTLFLAEGLPQGQQLPEFSACRQLYDERNYVAARSCFSKILAVEPDNSAAKEYYRLSNVLTFTAPQGQDSSHAPGTPRVATLEELVREAVSKNPAVRRLQLQLEAVRQRQSASPQIEAVHEALRLGLPAFPAPAWSESPNSSLSPEAEETWRLLDQKWWEFLFETQKNEIVFQVRKAYFALEALRQEFVAHEEHRRRLREHKRITLSKYNEREASQSEILEAQREESAGIEDLIELERRETIARATLNSLLNRDPGAPIQLPGAARVTEFSWNLRQLEELAIAHRPEVKAAAVSVEMLGLLQGSESKDEHPSRLLASEAELETIQNRVKREVHEAVANAENSFRLLRFNETSLSPQLEAAVSSAQGAYRGGEGDYVAWLLAQHRVTANQLRQIGLRRDYAIFLAELQKVVAAPLPVTQKNSALPF